MKESDLSREQLEARLREAEAALAQTAKLRERDEERKHLFTLVDSIPDSIYCKDRQSRFVIINQALAGRFALNHPREAVGKTDFDFFTERHATEARCDEEQVMSTGRALVSKEEPETWPDGTVTWVSTTKLPLHDRDGAIVGVCGISRDITERKSAEDSLRQSEESFRQLAEATLEAVLVHEAGLVANVNKAFVDMFGFEAVDIVGQEGWILIAPESQNLVRRHVRERREEPYEVECVRKDGSTFLAELRARHIERDGRDLRFVGVRDVSDRKQMEEDLRRSNMYLSEALTELKRTQQRMIQHERLSAVGQMASGIAHDFNNALMPILGFSEFLLSNSGVLDSNREETLSMLKDIHAAAQDATQTVRRLRDFYGPGDDGARTVIDINQLIEAAVRLTQPKWKQEFEAKGMTIAMTTELGDVPCVKGNETQLREAVTNLIFNAVDAMPEGGAATVRSYSQGEWVAIEVEDTGSGMTDEVRQKCFEPFFSTKGQRGTGMGLAVTYGTIRRHEGSIDVRSEPDKGTTVTFRLPARPATEEADVAAAPPPPPPPPQSILVIDDDPRSGSMLRRVLSEDGHTVQEARSGKEGLAVFEQGTFDVVISDRAMPDMSGDQVATAIKALRPKTPVILVTGFGDIMKDRGEVPDCVDAVVGKPVSVGDLRRAIESVL